jgi:hypothetical protein
MLTKNNLFSHFPFTRKKYLVNLKGKSYDIFNLKFCFIHVCHPHLGPWLRIYIYIFLEHDFLLEIFEFEVFHRVNRT